MAKLKKNDLGFLGDEYQFKLVKTFIENSSFFKQLYNIIDHNMFTDRYLRDCVGILKEYYEKYEVVPSYTMLGIKLNESSSTEIDQEYFKTILSTLKETSSEGVDEIKERAIKFFRQQKIIKAANEILLIASDGDTSRYDDCVRIVEETNINIDDDDLGIGLYDNIDETLSPDFRNPIPTGIGKLDEALEGGIGKGELGVIIAPSGVGKTSITTAMAAHAITYKCEDNNYSGYKVLQIVFEDTEKQIQRKHYGRLTGIEAKDLSKNDNIEYVRETLLNHPEKELIKKNFKLKTFLSGEVGANGIRRFIKKLINSGFKPDLVIVDYFECVEIEKGNENEWKRETQTMRKFEAIAKELEIALWIPTQGSKDSVKAEVITIDQGSGSFGKIQVANIVIAIARSMADINKNIANISVNKNRGGKSGQIINGVEFNNGTCIIKTDNVIEFDDAMEFQTQQKQIKAESVTNTAREIFRGMNQNNS